MSNLHLVSRRLAGCAARSCAAGPATQEACSATAALGGNFASSIKNGSPSPSNALLNNSRTSFAALNSAVVVVSPQENAIASPTRRYRGYQTGARRRELGGVAVLPVVGHAAIAYPGVGSSSWSAGCTTATHAGSSIRFASGDASKGGGVGGGGGAVKGAGSSSSSSNSSEDAAAPGGGSVDIEIGGLDELEDVMQFGYTEETKHYSEEFQEYIRSGVVSKNFEYILALSQCADSTRENGACCGNACTCV